MSARQNCESAPQLLEHQSLLLEETVDDDLGRAQAECPAEGISRVGGPGVFLMDLQSLIDLGILALATLAMATPSQAILRWPFLSRKTSLVLCQECQEIFLRCPLTRAQHGHQPNCTGARFPMLNAPVLRFMRHARPSLSRVLHTTLSTVSGHYFATPPQTRTCSSQSFRRYRGPRCCMRRLKMLRLEDIDLLGMPSFSTSLQGPA